MQINLADWQQSHTTEGHLAEVMDTLLAAFQADEAVRFLYPGDADFSRCFPGFVNAMGGQAFTSGAIDTLPGGAALWVAPGTQADETALGAYIEETLRPDRLDRLGVGFAAQDKLHPTSPHWYLPFIGIRPEFHGQGLGSALLRQGLDRADRERMPAYLEATNRRNARFYARHGFETIGVVEAPAYPEIIAMWRLPQARRT